jgi:hypothetical protein
MKTLQPVDKATYEKIGTAYAICAEYPEVFGDVTLEKFCSMFVDVIPEGEDEREARMKASAREMYELLKVIAESRSEKEVFYLAVVAQELVSRIDGEEVIENE